MLLKKVIHEIIGEIWVGRAMSVDHKALIRFTAFNHISGNTNDFWAKLFSYLLIYLIL